MFPFCAARFRRSYPLQAADLASPNRCYGWPGCKPKIGWPFRAETGSSNSPTPSSRVRLRPCIKRPEQGESQSRTRSTFERICLHTAEVTGSIPIPPTTVWAGRRPNPNRTPIPASTVHQQTITRKSVKVVGADDYTAVGRTTISSTLTCGGRVTAHTMQSATSSAASEAIPSYVFAARTASPP